MSKLRSFLKKIAEDQETQFVENKVFNQDGSLKDEVVHFILSNAKIDGDFDADEGEKATSDYPGTPPHVSLEVECEIPTSSIESKFGKLLNEDLAKLKVALEKDETGEVAGELKSIMEDFADKGLTSFSVDEINVSVDATKITIKANATDFEFDGLEE